jgi:hypothetical protein
MFTSRVGCRIYTNPGRAQQRSAAADTGTNPRRARRLTLLDEGSPASRWCFALGRKVSSRASHPSRLEVRQ